MSLLLFLSYIFLEIYYLELVFTKNTYQNLGSLFTSNQVFFMNQGVQKTPRHPAG